MSEPTPQQDSSNPAAYDLDTFEVRVLAVLIEKSFITPDNYPLSVNALMNGCNQLTGREPVMQLGEDSVQAALDSLMERRLVSRRDQAGARVAKYEHLIRLRYSLPPAEQAVLATLMLRGPQTPGEIRQRCERLHAFREIAEVETVLQHLEEKYPPMVTALPRAPGTKETRYAQLLGGEVDLSLLGAGGDAADGAPRGRMAALEDEVRRLRQELDDLRQQFDGFRRQFE